MGRLLGIVLVLFASQADAQVIRAPEHIESRLDSLAALSPTLQKSLDRLRSTPGARLFIHEQAIPDPEALAVTLHDEAGLAVVVWDSRKIRRLKDKEVNALLIHEVYGHALPYVLDGERCEDSRDGDSYRHSCVSQRQEVVFRELGMARRVRYSQW